MGAEDDLRDLVRRAHALGIRVILDGVFNHVSSDHPFFRDVLEKGRASRYYSCLLYTSRGASMRMWSSSKKAI